METGANTEHTRGQVKAHLFFGDLCYFMGVPMCNLCQNRRVYQFCDSVLIINLLKYFEERKNNLDTIVLILLTTITKKYF